MAESKKMMAKEVAFMKKKGAPKSMIKHEKAEMKGMKKGGAVKTAAPSIDGLAKKGKTKGTKPGMRKALFNQIKNSATQGTAAGQWSARKAQLLAKRYKEKGGGYKG